MKITKATRWRVFAGVWIQSLFTSATAFFSLFSLPMCNQFGWSSSDFSMAYTIYMFIYCAVGFLGGILAEKLQPRVAIYIGLILFAAQIAASKLFADNGLYGLPQILTAGMLGFTGALIGGAVYTLKNARRL